MNNEADDVGGGEAQCNAHSDIRQRAVRMQDAKIRLMTYALLSRLRTNNQGNRKIVSLSVRQWNCWTYATFSQVFDFSAYSHAVYEQRNCRGRPLASFCSDEKKMFNTLRQVVSYVRLQCIKSRRTWYPLQSWRLSGTATERVGRLNDAPAY